jgi:hypothetical protein
MKNKKPILFSSSMINAILSGEKDITRRIVNLPIKKSKYSPGDRLWVRETWAIGGYDNSSGYEIYVKYRADNTESGWIDIDNEELWERLILREEERSLKNKDVETPILWRPSIFLPCAASRLSLDIVTARIERLHKLDDEEARREGFKNREDFKIFWDNKNKGRGFPWEANPLVYRIEFERVK